MAKQPSDIEEIRRRVFDRLAFNVRWLALQIQRSSAYAERYFDHGTLRFWTSLTATAVYSTFVMSVLFQRAWILYASIPVITAQVLWVILKWVVYILDDPHIYIFFDFVSFWMGRFLLEGVKLIRERDLKRILVARLLARLSPRGIQYVKLALRLKMKQVSDQFMEELGHGRYKHLTDDQVRTKIRQRAKTFQRKVTAVKSTLEAIVKEVPMNYFHEKYGDNKASADDGSDDQFDCGNSRRLF